MGPNCGAVGWIIGGSSVRARDEQPGAGDAGRTANVRRASRGEHRRVGSAPVAIRLRRRSAARVDRVADHASGSPSPRTRRNPSRSTAGRSSRSAHGATRGHRGPGGGGSDAPPPGVAQRPDRVHARRRRRSGSRPTCRPARPSSMAVMQATSGSATNVGGNTRRATSSLPPPAAKTPMNSVAARPRRRRRASTRRVLDRGIARRRREDHLRRQPVLGVQPEIAHEGGEPVEHLLADPQLVREVGTEPVERVAHVVDRRRPMDDATVEQRDRQACPEREDAVTLANGAALDMLRQLAERADEVAVGRGDDIEVRLHGRMMRRAVTSDGRRPWSGSRLRDRVAIVRRGGRGRRRRHGDRLDEPDIRLEIVTLGEQPGGERRAGLAVVSTRARSSVDALLAVLALDARRRQPDAR